MKLIYRRFTLTYDNPRGGDYGRVARALRRLGDVELVRYPRTTLRLTPRCGTSFLQIKRAIAGALDPYRGSGLLFSQKTGFEYLLCNRGNNPGHFARE